MNSASKFENGITQIIANLSTFNTLDRLRDNPFDFVVNGKKVGVVLANIAETLKAYDNCFSFKEQTISLSPVFNSADAITKAIEEVLLDLRSKEAFKCLKGWRDEQYHVRPLSTESPLFRTQRTLNPDLLPSLREAPLFRIERAAATLFGIKQLGCHITGYVIIEVTLLINHYDKNKLANYFWNFNSACRFLMITYCCFYVLCICYNS